MKFLAGIALGILLGALAMLALRPGPVSANGGVVVASPSAPTTMKAAPTPAPKSLAPLSTSSDAQRERAAGRYVLDSEIPWLRDRLSKNDEAALAAIMQQVGPEYERLFAQLGVNAEQRAQLLHHLALIYKEKRDVKLRQTSLVNAQSAFDSRLKSLLAPEKYAEYRAYEDFDRARRESAQFTDFASTVGQSALSPERLADLQELVDATGAYSARTVNQWGGAFHEAAAPYSSARSESFLNEAIASLRVNSTALLEEARRRGFTAAELEILQRYYRKEISAYEQQLTDTRDPVGAQARWLERRILTLSADPRTNPEVLQRLKDSLALLRAAQPPRN